MPLFLLSPFAIHQWMCTEQRAHSCCCVSSETAWSWHTIAWWWYYTTCLHCSRSITHTKNEERNNKLDQTHQQQLKKWKPTQSHFTSNDLPWVCQKCSMHFDSPIRNRWKSTNFGMKWCCECVQIRHNVHTKCIIRSPSPALLLWNSDAQHTATIYGVRARAFACVCVHEFGCYFLFSNNIITTDDHFRFFVFVCVFECVCCDCLFWLNC